MNVLHLKYAVEVAKAGSINRAAETLLIGQPNLSRAIKELETSLGISIFKRTTRGMTVTDEGEVFLGHARKILKQINDVEKLYDKEKNPIQKFSMVCEGADYISEAFAAFAKKLSYAPAEIKYEEAASRHVIESVLSRGSNLGIVRFLKEYQNFFEAYFELKGIVFKEVSCFEEVVVLNKLSPLAEKSEISEEDLKDLPKVVGRDTFVPFMTGGETRESKGKKRFYVSGRKAQMQLMGENAGMYMKSAPLSQKQLSFYSLVQKKSKDAAKTYTDVLIYNKDYQLSEIDNLFLKELSVK